MKKLLSFVVLGTCLLAGAAQAQSCDAKAVDKNGKPLSGAAKSSFVKKCEKDAMDGAAAACAAKAVDKNGKALAGAAKSSFMKKCEQEAVKG
ncbi:hypothetical protein QTH91_10325 [Variovorax dokdonensis]|uniref:PsiF repeat-containing protein n=1 Tax=Variovorax dokdonensis TaxID=344883 RepID=A0ABT7NAB1_9BURK|nr:hypothetical protein [Variovorax dokdonensis]MDM0044880.1 hypothetical protein [Variovorax dokdonensis]